MSTALLILLILNLNMAVPAMSYAAAEETCTCHLNSSGHQCHLDGGCKSCRVHGHKKTGREAEKWVTIKTQPCGSMPAHDEMATPVLTIPFLIAEFSMIIPAQASSLINSIEHPFYGVTTTPSEKPPQA